MSILLNNDGSRHEEWISALRNYLSGREVIEFTDISNPAKIEYAIVWNHPKGDLRRYPNLKAVLSTGAGTEHFDQDSNLPDAPIFRLVDPEMAEDMAMYVLYWAIHIQRGFQTYRAQQAETHWKRYPAKTAADFHITVVGLGAIGGHIAARLAANGFKVTGYAASQKDIAGVRSITEDGPLRRAMGASDLVVNVLPFTDETANFIDAKRLAAMKEGSHLINVSRGPVIDDAALLEALGTRHIGSAILDVFAQEPLPKDSPYWAHPNVHVTPHMSGMTNPDSAARIIAETIKTLERGDKPAHQYVKPKRTMRT